MVRRHYAVLATVSSSYPPLSGRSPATLLTRPLLVSKKALSPVTTDLHVLGLPPAFNLSHDQTLQLKVFDAQRNRKLNIPLYELSDSHSSRLDISNFLEDIVSASAHTDCLIIC